MADLLKIGKDIIGAAFNVRKNTGRGMLEKFYESALVYELKQMGYQVERQVAIPAIYKGEIIQDAYRADVIVENQVIIETKALSYMDSLETCQLNTYLKLSGYRLGYLINFGARDFRIGNLKDEPPYEYGIYRMVNGF
ncbi:MAG: GxxExxY protein [Muribaculaceae bacterium]|nr:GxxExxY protein [Muribaculaceae bacterium]